jgi:hypothetical protein
MQAACGADRDENVVSHGDADDRVSVTIEESILYGSIFRGVVMWFPFMETMEKRPEVRKSNFARQITCGFPVNKKYLKLFCCGVGRDF